LRQFFIEAEFAGNIRQTGKIGHAPSFPGITQESWQNNQNEQNKEGAVSQEHHPSKD